MVHARARNKEGRERRGDTAVVRERENITEVHSGTAVLNTGRQAYITIAPVHNLTKTNDVRSTTATQF